MNLPVRVRQEEFSEPLLLMSPMRPVPFFGSPGIGIS